MGLVTGSRYLFWSRPQCKAHAVTVHGCRPWHQRGSQMQPRRPRVPREMTSKAPHQLFQREASHGLQPGRRLKRKQVPPVPLPRVGRGGRVWGTRCTGDTGGLKCSDLSSPAQRHTFTPKWAPRPRTRSRKTRSLSAPSRPCRTESHRLSAALEGGCGDPRIRDSWLKRVTSSPRARLLIRLSVPETDGNPCSAPLPNSPVELALSSPGVTSFLESGEPIKVKRYPVM